LFLRQEFSAGSAPIVIKLCKTSFRAVSSESRVADGSITTSEALRKYGATIHYYEKFATPSAAANRMQEHYGMLSV
jgi:hypothetical protein